MQPVQRGVQHAGSRPADSPASHAPLPAPRRNAIVLPAFETQDDGEAGRQVALRAVREGKPFVVNKFQ